MPARYPAVAGMFYPEGENACREKVRACLDVEVEAVEGTIWGGMVPHAGWDFSGPTAGRVFAALNTQDPPEAFIFFGAIHRGGVGAPSLYGSGEWRTPLGTLPVDEELAELLLDELAGDVVNRPQAHAYEHSIEVQLPFVKYRFPEAKILPLAMPPVSQAHDLGREIAKATEGIERRIVAIASSDLTHYGPRYGFTPAGTGASGLDWMRENDRRLLQLVEEMRASEIVGEAQAHHNACGAGAIAAAMGYALGRGADKGIVLHYTSSHDVMPMGQDAVGYGAAVFITR
ncbi:MAG: AmmeMemoRadiSam system protein B [Chloroflexota bacterium]|nr:AmmeMemoRadiSam system protein B [Chloroflexota bacterium]